MTGGSRVRPTLGSKVFAVELACLGSGTGFNFRTNSTGTSLVLANRVPDLMAATLDALGKIHPGRLGVLDMANIIPDNIFLVLLLIIRRVHSINHPIPSRNVDTIRG
jgi:hypothetical protein